MIGVGFLVSAISTFLVMFTTDFNMLLLLAVGTGVGGSLAMPAATAIATEIGRTHGMGTTFSVFNSGMTAGMIVGPMLAGVFKDLFGIWMVFPLGALIVLFGALWFLRLMRQAEAGEAGVI